MADDPTNDVPVSHEIGVTGLRHQAGRLNEEWLRKLQGDRGRRVYREMDDNDDILGVVRLLFDMFFRNVEWSTTPWSDDPLHIYQAEVAESWRTDMEHTWSDLMSEILTMMTYGFAPFEIVLKRRVGPDESEPWYRSAHSDRLIGIRKIAPRAQESVSRWDISEDGTMNGMYQRPPYTGGEVFIPAAKLVNFRTTSRRNNPEGRSAYRNCVIPYHRKRDISEFEAIGINRDLCGLARMRAPGAALMKDPPPQLAGVRAELEQLLEDVHNDEMSGILLSSDCDPQTGKPLYDFDLVTSGGSARFDTSAIIQRYDVKLAQNFLAGFILLGHQQHGSFALSDDQTSTFTVALGGWLNGVADTLNRTVMPLMARLNGWATNALPTWTPGDFEKEAVDRLASAITSLTTVGQLTPGDEETENHLRRKLGLPELPEAAEAFTRPAPGQQGPQGPGPQPAPEPGAPLPEEAKDALDSAQIQALMGIVVAVASGELPRSSGVELILAGFPLDRADAERIVGDAGRGFVPASPEVPPP